MLSMMGTRVRIRMGLKVLGKQREMMSIPQNPTHPHPTLLLTSQRDWGEPTDLHLIRLDYKCTLQRPNQWVKKVSTFKAGVDFFPPKLTKSAFMVVACKVHLEPWKAFKVGFLFNDGFKLNFTLGDHLNLSYLLVKQSPEHWKWHVQKEDLQHHFYLGNKKFLEQRGTFIDSITLNSSLNWFKWELSVECIN